jgi:hypothetical protein
MASTSPVSSQFSEGYGDFAIRSRDGVTCYFPGIILSHASPVFRDMFGMVQGSVHEGTKDRLVDVTEPLPILELFLKHLDPTIITPPIDPDTIRDLLIMADKYQTGTILPWFEQEAVTQRVNRATSQSQDSLLDTHPLLVLSLAMQFQLKQITDAALKVAVGCNEKLLYVGSPTLSLSIFFQISQLRDQRIGIYLTIVGILASHKFSPPKGCVGCSPHRAQWVLDISNAVRLQPQWMEFMKAFDACPPCTSCRLSWNEPFRSLLEDWKDWVTRKQDNVALII